MAIVLAWPHIGGCSPARLGPPKPYFESLAVRFAALPLPPPPAHCPQKPTRDWPPEQSALQSAETKMGSEPGAGSLHGHIPPTSRATQANEQAECFRS